MADHEMFPIEPCGGVVYGYEVWFRVEIHREESTVRWHRKARLSSILRAVRAKRGYRFVERVIEYTEKQYRRCFGSGSENGAVQWREGQRETAARFSSGEMLREFFDA